MAPITFEHVTKRFDETIAVADLDIEVADGEFLVLVGPSGCGKTTALRMLAGLEDITSGRILIGDRVVNNIAPDAVAFLREARGEQLLVLATRAAHDPITVPFGSLETLYGADAAGGVLPSDGPAFHIWRIR